MTADAQPVAFPRTVEDKATVKQQMHDLYVKWQQRLPSTPRALRRLRLDNLVLPLRLQDFGHEHTRSYLLAVGEREQTAVFAADSPLVQAIDQVTHGHPLFLALAAEAVLEAEALGHPLQPTEFQLQRAKVSPEIAPRHAAEAIGEYLLELFLQQLPDAERKELILCAVPRVLDVDVLRVLLPSLDRIDAPSDERWQAIRQRSFLNAVDKRRSVVHPVVRGLLLRRLPVIAGTKSDFVRIHTQLQDHFTQRARRGEDEAGIEAAYHALALGDADPAIHLGILAQQSRLPLSLWEPLLETVRQAPTDLLPENSKARAKNTLARAQEQHEMQDAAAAVVLYTWLLSAAHDDREEGARLQNNLGLAYWDLPTGDRAANVQHAIDCFQAALQVRTREAFPADWAMTQHNLGRAYIDLPTGDRAANLQHAIDCFQAALQVRAREAFPVRWASTQNNLGRAYWDLPTGDRAANLQQAIDCLQAALQVRTREAFPADWAMTQNNLGNAYSLLPIGDRAANLQRAIDCYQAALQVHTREAFPSDWAMTQNNLGIAYRSLPSGDRAANLQRAIDCFQAALPIYTREAFPADWAGTQISLGDAYSLLPIGDRAANLQHAIDCFQAALQIYTREAFPADWAMTQNDLGEAYRSLPTGARHRLLPGRLTDLHPRGLPRRLGRDADWPGECLLELTYRGSRRQPAARHRLLPGRLADLHPGGLPRQLGHDPSVPGGGPLRLTYRGSRRQPAARHRLLPDRLADLHPGGLPRRLGRDAAQSGGDLQQLTYRGSRRQPTARYRLLPGRLAGAHPRGLPFRLGHDPERPGGSLPQLTQRGSRRQPTARHCLP